jgi:putative endonuclease
MEKSFWVYILTSRPYGTLYIGVTSDLPRRCFEHREGLCDGFTKKYGIKMLVYCEEYPTAYEAITREKELKKWKREWKKQLIETINPTWRDLYEHLNN